MNISAWAWRTGFASLRALADRAMMIWFPSFQPRWLAIMQTHKPHIMGGVWAACVENLYGPR